MSDSTRSEILKKFGEFSKAGHKSWVFTCNNYTEKELKTLYALDCTRKCIGREVGEKNGTPHLQGCICFSKNFTWRSLMKISPRCVWEKCISITHAWNYCLKEGNFDVQDNRVQGQRNETYSYRDRIAEGATDKQLCQEFPVEFLKFSRTDKMRAALLAPDGGSVFPRRHKTRGLWFYGKADSGKSTWLRDHYPNACWMEYDGKYFSHYNNAEVVIFDDCNFNKFSRSLILKLVNCTPYKIRQMGSYCEFNSKTVIFCSNYDWGHYWQTDPALTRRLQTHYFTGWDSIIPFSFDHPSVTTDEEIAAFEKS